MGEPSDALRFGGLVDLASGDLGGRALWASDDFFAEVEHLTNPDPAVFDPDAFTDRGKLMDGWESRRKRTPGHDRALIKLGAPGTIRALDIDTSHFLGNHPPFASLEACTMEGDPDREALDAHEGWVEVLASAPLRAGSHNLFAVQDPGTYTHVRLHIYPAGGVARLRVLGEVARSSEAGDEIDLTSAANGARAIVCTDMFFAHMDQLLLPREPANMGDGWETRRRRGPGHDWIVLELAAPGVLSSVELDTRHFKGNFPDTFTLDGLLWPGADAHLLSGSDQWQPVLGHHKLSAHNTHTYPVAADRSGPFSHLRLSIYPDGGVSRLRCFGRVVDESGQGATDPLLRALNQATSGDATEAFSRCCGARRWAEAMTASRPYVSRAQLFGTAESAWWRLAEGDWREAFTHHPKIGTDVDALREKFQGTADLSESEQAGVQGASEDALEALAAGNADYEQRYGYIFIVCATGKGADEMLGLLRQRMNNTKEAEIFVAAGEQAKITRLRLEGLEP